MNEDREQLSSEPVTALNAADEERTVSEESSQADLGKFKDASTLLAAYNNLQAEFTRKCQLLSRLQKDKIDRSETESSENGDTVGGQDFQDELNVVQSSEESISKPAANEDEKAMDALRQFLGGDEQAKSFIFEIENSKNSGADPYREAWAKLFFSQTQKDQLAVDTIVNQYVLSDENVKKKIIEEYLSQLKNNQPPKVMPSQGGVSVSGVLPDRPSTLAEAKKIVDKMFS